MPRVEVHRNTETRRRNLAGAILLLLALLLYAVTLDNGLQPGELLGGDLITHQYAQVQARPSNAPGYPLYTMGGWLWFHGIRTITQAVGISAPDPLPCSPASARCGRCWRWPCSTQSYVTSPAHHAARLEIGRWPGC
ncbi:MAG: hypothetical protein IPM07_13625 [Anaerolineales bacterium]|nr:hypothetical protein [Anaerolineales bacterium]